MKIKGMEYKFYCAKCKKPVKEVSSNQVEEKNCCECVSGSSTGKNETKYTGIRF
jgi:hypothetical protein